jgi:hypothetical protein
MNEPYRLSAEDASKVRRRVAGTFVIAALGLAGLYALNHRDEKPSQPVALSSPPAIATPAERLIWNIDTDNDIASADKGFVREGALKVLSDDRNCAQISVGGRSTTKPGAYYVTCEPRNRGTVYNVWFTPAQVADSTRLAAPTAYPESFAREACEREIRARVTNPSTLDLHRFTGYATSVHNNGNRTLVQDFTASNALGVGSKYEARCLVLPNGAVEITITHAQQ